MSLNRRYRVVRRFGGYQVERRWKADGGKNIWHPLKSFTAQQQQEAMSFCGDRGLPYIYLQEIGWT